MQGFEGTKGPWIASVTDRSIGPVCRDDDQSYGMILPVAWVEFDGKPGHHQANANLIAAAPELLEALQLSLTAMNEMGDILNFHDMADAESVEKLTPAFEMAWAAISKALGK